MNILTNFNYYNIKRISIDEELDKSNLVVFKGKLNNKDIAIKEYIVNEDGRLDNNIINELYIGKNIDSERLLKIYGYSHNKDKSKYYLLMEYINKGSVYQYIHHDKYYMKITYKGEDSGKKPLTPYYHTPRNGSWNYIMSEQHKFSITKSILKAIKSMYENNIIHGDLKPDNLAVHKENNDLYIKVIDYGTCFHSNGNIKLKYVIGTHGYASPEQDEYILNHKSDIYSIGVTIIEIWVGTIFYKRTDKFNEIRNEILKSLRIIKKDNPELEKILRKCINTNYKKRPDIYQLYDMITNIE